MAVGEPSVVEAHLVENGGMKVMHMALIFGDGVAVVIGFAIGDAAFEASTGPP